jgi:predicted PurR-regulated permease PerM
MKENFIQYLKPITGIAILGFMFWYFSDIVAYVLIAIFLSMIGAPLLKLLNKIKIRKKSLPKALNAAVTLIIMLLVFFAFILIFVPLIIQQANVIASIDIDALLHYYQEPIQKLKDFLVQYNVIQSEEVVMHNIEMQLREFIDLSKFTDFFGNILSATGSVFMGIFIILFLTFYSLLDDGLWKELILMLTPEEQIDNMKDVMNDSKSLLIRYFQGILLEVVIMMTLESTGLLIFGIPNALLIGFFGGMMNVIPYVGPIIGASLGIILVILSELSLENYDQVMTSVIIVVAIFGGANLIDNMILQPQIYSKSVKAHPVEVFLAIIVGGKLAGIAGMILAIPTYTVIKVIARQFMQRMKLVKFLTSKM